MRAILVTLLLLASTPALAADAAAAKSKALYQQAQANYDRGEMAKALELYLQAYEAKALPGFLFNIAQCHRQLRNYERAAFYFKRYLALAPRTPNAQVVRDLIAEVEARQSEADDEKRVESERATLRNQEVELARIAAAQAESEAVAQAQEQNRKLERALLEKPSVVIVEAPPTSSVLTKWWLWAGVGVLVAGGVAAGAGYVATAPSARPTTLGTDSVR